MAKERTGPYETPRFRWAFLLAGLLLGGLLHAPPAAAEAETGLAAGRLWLGGAALADLPVELQDARRARNRTNAWK